MLQLHQNSPVHKIIQHIGALCPTICGLSLYINMLKFGGNFRLKSHCKSNRSECSFSESVLTDRRRSVAALSEQIDRRICQFRIHFDRFGRRFLFTRDRETRDRQPDRMNTRLAGRRRIAKSSGPLLVCWPTANHDRQSSLSPFAAAVAVSSFTKCQPVS